MAAPPGIWITEVRAGGDGPALAVKDLFDTAGVRTTYGSKVFADHVPDRTAAAVELLAGAGYRLVGKANLHEFAWGITSENPHYGTVPNPIAPGRVAGGSSGGSAAALAAGLADAALGSDSAGSIRIPSACCGTTGHKPTHGLVPIDGCWPLAPSYDVAGPMANDVAGCVRMMAALAGGLGPAALDALGDVRVGVAWTDRADPLVRARVEAAAALFPHRTALDLPVADGIYPGFAREAVEIHAPLYAEHRDLYGENVATKVTRSLELTDAEVEAARAARERYRARMAELTADVDLVVTPTIPTVAPPTGVGDLALRGRMIELTFPWSALGAPALALPCGPAEDGLPASVQIAGRAGDDALVLAAGGLLERALAERGGRGVAATGAEAGEPDRVAARGAATGPFEEERRTSPVELLWDLVFVFAVTQVTTLLSHDLTWAGFGRSMLVLALVWWAWSAFVWAANAQDTDDPVLRLALLLAMLLAFVAGLSVPHAFDDEALVFAATYAGVRLLHLALYADASRKGHASWAAIAGFAVTVLIGMALLVAGALLGGGAQIALWTAAAAIDYAGPAWLTRERLRGLQHVAVAHFAERYSLFVIICLGESILALGVGASAERFDAELVAAVGLGLVIAVALWWTYFDRFAALAEERLRTHDDPVLAAADAYSYLHLVIVAGIIVFAVGVKEAVGAVGAPLGDPARLALCGGVALYLSGHVAFGLRMVGALGVEKLVAAVAVLALYVVGGSLDAWLLAGAVAAILAGMCAVETVRARRAEPLRPAG